MTLIVSDLSAERLCVGAADCFIPASESHRPCADCFVCIGLPRLVYRLCGELGWRQAARTRGLSPRDLSRRP